MTESIDKALLKECIRRRADLMGMIGPQAAAIIPGALQKIRNNDVHYPFRQDSDFWYLTGFNEPDAMLVLLPSGGTGNAPSRSILFCRERDILREQWDGPRAGLEGAMQDYAMDDAFPITDIDDILPGLLEGREQVHFPLGRDSEFDQRVIAWTRYQRRGSLDQSGAMPEELVSLTHLLHELRVIKTRYERQAMRRAAEVSAAAHVRAMRAVKKLSNERELMAELLYEYTRSGCQASYEPIVAAGANACVLHYLANNQPIHANDLVLIDSACEYANYAADITRTFPARGKFSAEQKTIYNIVLEAQLSAISKATTRHHWDDVHDAALTVIIDGLLDIGLLSGSREQAMETRSYQRFFMHKTGHWLGLDVHDVGDYQVDQMPRQLEPGMVMTVEPGIYISADDESVDERWRGIGVRIEDDVLVTKTGPEILSESVPKAIDEIEALVQGG